MSRKKHLNPSTAATAGAGTLVPAKKRQQSVPQSVPAVQEPESLLTLISKAARDPTVDVAKMQALLDMRATLIKQEAEVDYNCAMRDAQSEMSSVVRDAQNTHTNSRYARLETIDAAIRPVYTKHGFSLSFNTVPGAEPEPPAHAASKTAKTTELVHLVCTVRHVKGHSTKHELSGALDMSGAKGTANKTSIQGLGSSVTYLRRYLTLMIFNLTLRDEDDDGGGGRARHDNPEQQPDVPRQTPRSDRKEKDQQPVPLEELVALGERFKQIFPQQDRESQRQNWAKFVYAATGQKFDVHTAANWNRQLADLVAKRLNLDSTPEPKADDAPGVDNAN